MRARVRSKAKAKPVVSELDKVANDIGLSLMPAARAHLKLVDVANRTDEDQRRTVRSGKPQTVRRIAAPLDRYLHAMVITQREYDAGDWWREVTHAGRYDTTKTASYEPRSSGASDPLARVVPFATKVADARFSRRDMAGKLSPTDINLLDALCIGAGFTSRGRSGQAIFNAARLSLRRLADALRLPG